MLPVAATNTIDHIQSAVIELIIFSVTGTLIGMLLADLLGGKSAELRQGIFHASVFIGVCIGISYASSCFG